MMKRKITPNPKWLAAVARDMAKRGITGESSMPKKRGVRRITKKLIGRRVKVGYLDGPARTGIVVEVSFGTATALADRKIPGVKGRRFAIDGPDQIWWVKD